MADSTSETPKKKRIVRVKREVEVEPLKSKKTYTVARQRADQENVTGGVVSPQRVS